MLLDAMYTPRYRVIQYTGTNDAEVQAVSDTFMILTGAQGSKFVHKFSDGSQENLSVTDWLVFWHSIEGGDVFVKIVPDYEFQRDYTLADIS